MTFAAPFSGQADRAVRNCWPRRTAAFLENMGTIDDLRQWLQDVILPELREIKIRLTNVETGLVDLRNETHQLRQEFRADLKDFRDEMRDKLAFNARLTKLEEARQESKEQ